MAAKRTREEKPKRVVFYIRVSSSHQDIENSVDGQADALQAYADSKGYIVVETYVDQAISGKRDDRPALNRLMRDASRPNPHFDEVLIWKFDRFGRRVATVARRATELEELGIELTAVQQPIQGKPSVVRFVRNLLGSVAEFFSDNMGEDIARGKRTSASHGVWTNSTIPFGFMREYRLDRGKMRPFLVPDPKTVHIIVRMANLYLDGTGSRRIANIFRDENVPGPNDKPWTPSRVLSMLKNIAYAGFIEYGERSKFDDERLLIPVPEMEIITLEQHEQIQAIMASHSPKEKHPREVASIHLLSGLIYCEKCISKMSPTGGKRSGYNCNPKRSGVSPHCDTPRVNADLLDAATLQHVVDKIITQENIDSIVAIVAKSETVTTLEVEEDLKDLTTKIEKQKNARRELLDLVEKKEKAIPEDIAERLTEIREELSKLEANAIRARAKVSNEKALTSDPKKVAAYAKTLSTYLRGTNVELTKKILQELIVQIRVRPGPEKDTASITIRYRIPTPPQKFTGKTDVEELILRKNVRSLEYPTQLVLADPQPFQVGEAAQLRRYLPAQPVFVEPHTYQVGEAAQLRRYLPVQLVVVEVQECQVGEVAQLHRYLPAQLVFVEPQPFQVGEAAQLRRYLPAQGVVVEVQRSQVGQAAQLWRYLLAQLVVVEPHTCQVGEAAQFRRYRPAQLVTAKAQIFQVGEAAQLRRYRPAQLVPTEVQHLQVGQIAQLRRYLPAQLARADAQPFQVGEVAQVRWNRPGQLVPVERQSGHSPRVVSGNTGPFFQGRVAKPVCVVLPVWAFGGMVEGDQGFPVCFGGAGSRRRCRSRCTGGSGRGP